MLAAEDNRVIEAQKLDKVVARSRGASFIGPVAVQNKNRSFVQQPASSKENESSQAPSSNNQEDSE
jgi:hypothetical protein